MTTKRTIYRLLSFTLIIFTLLISIFYIKPEAIYATIKKPSKIKIKNYKDSESCKIKWKKVKLVYPFEWMTYDAIVKFKYKGKKKWKKRKYHTFTQNSLYLTYDTLHKAKKMKIKLRTYAVVLRQPTFPTGHTFENYDNEYSKWTKWVTFKRNRKNNFIKVKKKKK